jgi:glycosyltransferase involved in cell wall biosynthesis
MSKETVPRPPEAAPTVAFLVTVDWYFYRHYRALASAVLAAGYRVLVITGVDAHGDAIRSLGFDLFPIKISRKGMHPVRELPALLRLVRVLRRIRPDLLHSIAQKPVLYGSLAARLTGIRAVVAALPGLGWLFTSDVRRARLGRGLVMLGYRLLLRGANVRVLVQNTADRTELKRVGGLDAVLIPGSGVDLGRFVPCPAPPGPVTIVLASRLLWDKGVGELVEAARFLRARMVGCRCVLVGMPDDGNPASVTRERLESWQAEGVIEWWGYREDMAAVLRQAHIACLPSYYREGIPKFLLEAAASGLPLVTTDMPGCRDTVEPEANGLLVPPRDAPALAAALRRLIEDEDLRERFGRRSRALAEERFGGERVAQATLAVYRDLLDPRA